MALSVAATGHAQGFRVVGDVVRVTAADSTPVSSQRVVLHSIAPGAAGPVDSSETDRRGRYRLLAPVLDTTATYIVSVEHDGIGYFSRPVHTFGTTLATAATIVVYDTTHAVPPIALGERHVVVRAAEADGARRVIDLLVLVNRGFTTRIAHDSTQPVWRGALPAGAVQFEVGDSDVSEQAVTRQGDSVLVLAPVPPGERQLLVSYLIPASIDRLPLPIDAPVQRLNVLLEDTTATLVADALRFEGVEELDGLFFRRYTGSALMPGSVVAIQFAPRPVALTAYWWLIVPITALTLAVALWWWLRRQRPMLAAADPEGLAAEIVVLDERFASRKDTADEREHEEYHRRRAELKRRLSQTLTAKR